MGKAEDEEKKVVEREVQTQAEEEEQKEDSLEEKEGRRASLMELEVERKTEEEGDADAADESAIESEGSPLVAEGEQRPRSLGEEEAKTVMTSNKKKKPTFLKRVKKALSCKGKKASVGAVAKPGKWQKYYDANTKKHYYSDGVRTTWTKPEQMTNAMN